MLAFVCSTLEMKLSVEGFSEIWGSFPSQKFQTNAEDINLQQRINTYVSDRTGYGL